MVIILHKKVEIVCEVTEFLSMYFMPVDYFCKCLKNT
jgi:hypothetical protein